MNCFLDGLAVYSCNIKILEIIHISDITSLVSSFMIKEKLFQMCLSMCTGKHLSFMCKFSARNYRWNVEYKVMKKTFCVRFQMWHAATKQLN